MKLFDAHFHVIDTRFHLEANNGFIPDAFPFASYENLLTSMALKVDGGAIISGSFQGYDTGYLQILKELTAQYPDRKYVAIANVKTTASDADILALAQRGVAGARFNLFRGNGASVTAIADFAQRAYEVAGWTIELQVNPQQLADMVPVLTQIPRLSIDHVGMRKVSIPTLYELADKGVKIKASGFGRLDFDPWPVLVKLNDIDPTTLMFGSDIPGTRVAHKFEKADIAHFKSLFDDAAQQRILHDNAYDWYINQK